MATISYLEYSKRDEKYAKDMFSLGNYDPCTRFCQQSVEKRFKHYIEKYGEPEHYKILTTHKLVALYSVTCEIARIEKDISLYKELFMLTAYYFDTNYPQEANIEATKEMAEDAINLMEQINTWIDSLF